MQKQILHAFPAHAFAGLRISGACPEFDVPRDNFNMVHLNLTRDEKTWRGRFEELIPVLHGMPGSIPVYPYAIPSGETRVFLAVPIQFPFLRELHTPFWDETLKEMENHPAGLDFDLRIDSPLPYNPRSRETGYGYGFDPDGQLNLKLRAYLVGQVTIKLRNPEEMKMIEDWHQERLKYSRSFNIPRDMNIIWQCAHFGNDYPNYPYAPKTWEGWKELEESITPSTMRDDIRLTRIVIQYCDTIDEKVLDELKEWFSDMNEIQRVVMAKSLRERIKRSCWSYSLYENRALLVPFRDLYRTIREYDMTVKPESGYEYDMLKKLKLLE